MNTRLQVPRKSTQSQSFSITRTEVLQCKCTSGGPSGMVGKRTDCRRKREVLERYSTDHAELTTIPPNVHEVLRSPDQPLDPNMRAFMESHFGHDLSQVRIHRDAQAAESARSVNALAYTVGQDIVFGAQEYAPHASEGVQLLAHELTHTLQQNASLQQVPNKLEIASPKDASEKEAENAARTILEGNPVTPTLRKPLYIARQEAEALPKCVPAPGTPNTNCGAYLASSWWLPSAYVNNATCACQTTPNVSTANCVRKFLQDRLAATPTWLKTLAAAQKPNDVPGSPFYSAYQTFVQTFLTPRIYRDHVDAYRSCCCPSGPASYPAWIGVTTIPMPCSLVGLAIRYFGSCSGTPGAW